MAATSRRDDTASQVESARSELNTLSGLLNKQRAIVYVQAKLVADLSDCVNAANQALNFLSFGDKDQGTKLLQDSTAKCESASQYLANLPAKP
jgi:hypothetical protein